MPRDASPRNILVVTGGHRVDLDAFLRMVASICDDRGWRWCHAVQPSAQRWLTPDAIGIWHAVLCHDIPGLRLNRGEPPVALGPDPGIARALVDLLQQGMGFVVTHHALAGWPAWDGWASALGGRFLYAPGPLRGRDWPSSGYRMARYRARVVDPDHAVCGGLSELEFDDELYCCPVFADEVVPLIRTDADVDGRLFTSAYESVLHGEAAAPDCAAHPPASDLIAWATTAERSPLVYVQPGDSAETFGNAGYRRLLGNALAWVSSPDADAWAGGHPRPIVLPPSANDEPTRPVK